MKFTYDNTLQEIDEGMKVYQKRFGSKRGYVMLAGYAILFIAAVVLLVLNPTNAVLYVAVVLCTFFFVMTATARSRRRKNVISRIESMPPEDYECILYKDKIEIRTYIKFAKDEDCESCGFCEDSEKSETCPRGGDCENCDKNKADNKPVIQIIPFNGEYSTDFTESNNLLILVVNGVQPFYFPKRCMTAEQADKMRTVLQDSTSEW